MEAGPVIISVFFFLSIVVIWGGVILTRHKERMTLIDKAPQPELVKTLYERQGKLNPLTSLKWGMMAYLK